MIENRKNDKKNDCKKPDLTFRLKHKNASATSCKFIRFGGMPSPSWGLEVAFLRSPYNMKPMFTAQY